MPDDTAAGCCAVQKTDRPERDEVRHLLPALEFFYARQPGCEPEDSQPVLSPSMPYVRVGRKRFGKPPVGRLARSNRVYGAALYMR